jgi:hypothetical protein
MHTSIRTRSTDHFTERGEGFDRVFRVVVIPRNSVIIKKGKKLVAIPVETLLVFNSYFALILCAASLL